MFKWRPITVCLNGLSNRARKERKFPVGFPGVEWTLSAALFPDLWLVTHLGFCTIATLFACFGAWECRHRVLRITDFVAIITRGPFFGTFGSEIQSECPGPFGARTWLGMKCVWFYSTAEKQVLLGKSQSVLLAHLDTAISALPFRFAFYIGGTFLIESVRRSFTTKHPCAKKPCDGLSTFKLLLSEWWPLPSSSHQPSSCKRDSHIELRGSMHTIVYSRATIGGACCSTASKCFLDSCRLLWGNIDPWLIRSAAWCL